MALAQQSYQRGFLKGISITLASWLIISLSLFGGLSKVDALSSPLAENQSGLSEVASSVSQGEAISQRTGEMGDNALGIVLEPADETEETSPQKQKMNMEDIFGSEQVFPFDP